MINGNKRKQRTRQLLTTVLGLALTVSLAACGGAAKTPNQGQLVDPPKAESGSGQGAAQTKRTSYPLKVKDATGKEFVFDKAPERIASTSPSETEMLFALGLGDKVVGVSDFCDYPAEAKSKPKLGSITKPNEEAIIAAGADLTLTGVSMKTPTVEKLRELKVNLFQVQPKTIDDVLANLLVMGEIFDRQAEAEKLVNQMKADRQQVVDAVKNLKPEQKKKVFIEFSPGWTVGSGEFLSELIETAGGINVYGSEKGYVKLSEEKVIAENPKVILYPNNLIDDKSKKPLDQLIRERSGWDQIDAVKEGKLAGIDKDTTSRPGPRITQGLKEIAKGIYPELVK
ncbi:iron complex transport system substrate-binding protein [Paenibacillus sp. UNCCL117]|uniref:ABC transporter substrate-binding protein n=1 Tax=unclassified Paenibacillus TaxID=185978 RepID=UPI0008806A81|nr:MULTISPECIES: ABC transporter substrate-binding protein [unclassified Paenibacillus]SDC00605.1 iron complex transport system substrate-binding protein [Paenibacillus sp. cl123]SFW36398.1 iron complex transport system substrate-binding protein [Paenibacillus sp. UNCCL117]